MLNPSFVKEHRGKSSIEEIERLENALSIKLPHDYKTFILETGGVDIRGTCIKYGNNMPAYIFKINEIFPLMDYFIEYETESDLRVSDTYLPIIGSELQAQFFCIKLDQVDKAIYLIDFNGYPESFIDPVADSFTDFLSNLHDLETLASPPRPKSKCKPITLKSYINSIRLRIITVQMKFLLYLIKKRAE